MSAGRELVAERHSCRRIGLSSATALPAKRLTRRNELCERSALEQISARPLLATTRTAELHHAKASLQCLGERPARRLSPFAGQSHVSALYLQDVTWNLDTDPLARQRFCQVGARRPAVAVKSQKGSQMSECIQCL